MTSEQQTERAKPVAMTREEFEAEAGKSTFFKPEAKKEYVFGFMAAEYMRIDFGKGLEPSLVCTLDYINEILEEPLTFSSSSKRWQKMIEDYRNNKDCNLFEWLFKFKREGTMMSTTYMLMPFKKRPQEAVQTQVE
jgi:hypothetical protein